MAVRTLNVGGQQQPQFMGPDAAGQSRKLAEALINEGMDTKGLTHWTQALGKVLQSGVGHYQNARATADVRDGSMAGNQALAQMLAGGSPDAAMANPYSASDALKMQVADRNASRSFANQKALLEEKLRMQNADPMRQLQMEKLRADIEATRNKGNVESSRLQDLEKLGIDPASPEGIVYQANGKLPAAAYQEAANKRKRTESAPKIAEGLRNLNRMTELYDDASFTNAVGPIQGADPDGGLLSAPFANISRAFGEVANVVEGGESAPSEVRSNVRGTTEALAAAIKPLIRGPGEGVWTDADQARLVSIVGDLAQARDKAEFKRRLNAVRDRINSNFGLEVDFDAMASTGAGMLEGRGNKPLVGADGFKVEFD